MRKDTQCFEDFKTYINSQYPVNLTLGEDYLVTDYEEIRFIGVLEETLITESVTWSASWNAASRYYKSFR